MKQELVNKIKEIHKSELFGIIIECGCAATITNTLMQVNGATNTIFYSYQPYSKIVQEDDYINVSQYRSVSEEFISEVLKKEFQKSERKNTGDKKINFCLTASFQLHDAKVNSLTHGWIGVKDVHTEKYYHLSIPESRSRQKYLEIIAETAINILYEFHTKEKQLASPYIDIVLEQCGGITNQLSDETLDILQRVRWLKEDNFIVFNNGQLKRFEDFCRNYKGIILQKGSFNPLHYGHMAIMDETRKLYPEYNYAYFVSISRFDKPDISTIELLMKTKANVSIIFCKSIFFEENVAWIRRRWKKLPIVFPIGSDTANRIMESTFAAGVARIELKWENVKFLVFKRKDMDLKHPLPPFFEIYKGVYKDDGVSSTKLRALNG